VFWVFEFNIGFSGRDPEFLIFVVGPERLQPGARQPLYRDNGTCRRETKHQAEIAQNVETYPVMEFLMKPSQPRESTPPLISTR
jgi:hypothetical protein